MISMTVGDQEYAPLYSPSRPLLTRGQRRRSTIAARRVEAIQRPTSTSTAVAWAVDPICRARRSFLVMEFIRPLHWVRRLDCCSNRSHRARDLYPVGRYADAGTPR